jgi:hypothetical protein
MVRQNFFPSIYHPCLVQINYKHGVVGFHAAKDFKDGLDSYGFSNIVAIFKCKLKKN